MFVTQAVAAHSYDTGEWNVEFLARRWDSGDKPWDLGSVCKAEDELVDYAIDTDGAGDKGEGCVGWIGEDEVVGIERCEAVFTYAATICCPLASYSRSCERMLYVMVGMWLTYG
jgi:hypothetical protein